ncbi:MAG: ATP-binding cassette domain-containing protein [Elusimicrobiota bacterium]
MIRFENVTFTYPGGITALRDFSLEIPKGQIVVFVGASGSGKTTAMRLINRMLEPTAGAVFVDGKDTRELDPIALRRRIGYVIQGAGLIPHMSVAQNVGLVPKLLGEDSKKINETVRRGLDTVHMNPENFWNRYPRKLSGGQRQRVGLARALAANPDLLLMDEPFGALDNVLREEMQDEFKQVFEETRKTIVLVTHDIHEAVHLGERIVVLKDGSIVSEGTPAEVVLRPKNDWVKRLLGRRRRDLEAFVREGA